MRKTIKKLASFIILFILITSQTYASEKTYLIDDIGISITFDDGYTVFTRETEPDDENLVKFGLSYTSLVTSFTQNNIVLEAFGTGFTHEIVIYAEKDDSEPYLSMDSEALYHAATDARKEFEKNGKTVTKCDIEETENAVYTKIEAQTDDSNRIIQYATVINNYKIKIELISYESKLEESIISDFENKVGNIKIYSTVNDEEIGKSDAEETISPIMPKIKKSANSSEKNNTDKGNGNDELQSTLIASCVILAVITLPVAVLRYIVIREHVPKKVSVFFSIWYVMITMAIVYFAADNFEFKNYLCIIPAIWGFVIYKIMK